MHNWVQRLWILKYLNENISVLFILISMLFILGLKIYTELFFGDDITFRPEGILGSCCSNTVVLSWLSRGPEMYDGSEKVRAGAWTPFPEVSTALLTTQCCPYRWAILAHHSGDELQNSMVFKSKACAIGRAEVTRVCPWPHWQLVLPDWAKTDDRREMQRADWAASSTAALKRLSRVFILTAVWRRKMIP